MNFTFNDEFWEQGFKYGCEYTEENGLSISRDNAMLKGTNNTIKTIYISKSLDSCQIEMIWNRIKIDLELPEDSMVSLSYFTSDEMYVKYNDEVIFLDEYINDTKISVVDKLSFLDGFWIQEIKNPKDIFLSRAKGRYMWFKIEMVLRNKNFPKVKGLKIEFGQESFISYLPDFYSNNQENSDFLKRFLGIYQNMILDLQEEINNVSKYMDSDYVDKDFLQWLSEWSAIDDTYIWTEGKLRKFVKKSFSLYKLKGTKEGLKQIIELYTNTVPIIVETYEVMECYDKNEYIEQYQKLYGEDKYSFTIFIQEQFVNSNQKLSGLKKIVEMYKPAHTIANIAVLKPFMNLGQHIYLGINSDISQNSALKLDENAMIPFNTAILS